MMRQLQPDRNEIFGIQFLLWVWPAIYPLFTSIFNPSATLFGWTALGVSFILLQGDRWLRSRPSLAPRWGVGSILLILLLVAMLLLPWQRFKLNPRFIQTGFLFIIAIALRALQIGILHDGTQKPGFLKAYVPITISGELLYITAWLYTAWTLEPIHRIPVDLHNFLTGTPYALCGFLLSLHFIYLQFLQHINPRHKDGSEWLKASSTAISSLILLVPVGFIPLFKLPSPWWLILILSLYAYRTLIYTHRVLKHMSNDEFQQDEIHKTWAGIRLRWFRQTIFYSLTLLAFLYLSLQQPGG